MPRRFKTRVSQSFVVCGLLSLAALGGCANPQPHAVLLPSAQPVATAAPTHAANDAVHIFLINGLDPFNYGQLDALAEHLRQTYRHTELFQMFESAAIEERIALVRERDPRARIVLVGFSFGANVARTVAQDLSEEDATIDLLVYLGGNTLHNIPRDRPRNVRRIVNVLALGILWHGAQLDGAANIQLNDTYHYGSPTHPFTIQMLEQELAALAAWPY